MDKHIGGTFVFDRGGKAVVAYRAVRRGYIELGHTLRLTNALRGTPWKNSASW